MENLVIIAKIGKTHGVKGALKLHTFTEDPSSILDFQQWFLRFPRKEWQAAPEFKLIPHGSGFLIHFKTLTNPEDAQRYVNAELSVSRAELPEPEAAHYWTDLIGLSVRNTEGAEFGQISQMMETGANDVMVLEGERERLIPYIKQVIVSVDLEAKEMVVDWGVDW
jgi:16S rRNA processing protein RimM